MFAATTLAIFIVPVLFVFITRISYGREKLDELKAGFKPEEHKESAEQ
ncbi:MAG: hypothetical protein ABIO76_02460 [Ginsengibacter sp.]